MKKIATIIASLALMHGGLAFAGTDLVDLKTGEAKDLAKVEGVKIVNFWASWCTHCLDELKDISSWYDANKKRVVNKGKVSLPVHLVTINLDDMDIAKKFASENKLDFPIWVYTGYETGLLLSSFGNKSQSLPYTVIFSEKCSHAERASGEVDKAKLDKLFGDFEKKCVAKLK